MKEGGRQSGGRGGGGEGRVQSGLEESVRELAFDASYWRRNPADGILVGKSVCVGGEAMGELLRLVKAVPGATGSCYLLQKLLRGY